MKFYVHMEPKQKEPIIYCHWIKDNNCYGQGVINYFFLIGNITFTGAWKVIMS